MSAQGFEHPEETAWRSGPTEIAFRSETYGDSDAIEIDIGDFGACRIAGLFLALERLTDQPLPRDVAGHIDVAPDNAAFGFRPVYFSGRQRDGSRVWSSAQFITFENASPVTASGDAAG